MSRKPSIVVMRAPRSGLRYFTSWSVQPGESPAFGLVPNWSTLRRRAFVFPTRGTAEQCAKVLRPFVRHLSRVIVEDAPDAR